MKTGNPWCYADQLRWQLAAVTDRLEMLSRRLDEQQQRQVAVSPAPAQPAEKLVAREQRAAAERVEEAVPEDQVQPPRKRLFEEELPNRQTTKPLEEQLTKWPHAQGEARSRASEEDLRAVRERLEDLARQFERYGRPNEGAAENAGTPKPVDPASHPVSPASASPLDQALLEIADRQRALEGEAAPIRREPPRPSIREIGEPSRQVRNNAPHQNSRPSADDSLQRLRADIRDLVEASSTDGLSLLERRITVLTETRQARTSASGSAQDLEDVIARLDEEVQRLQIERNAVVRAKQFESRLARLLDKMDASDARLAQVEAIRCDVAELLAHMETRREQAHSKAAATPAVDSLKNEVLRTQGSLQAVHGTLGKLVERLNALETGNRTATAPTGSRPQMAPRPAEERPPPSPPSHARQAAILRPQRGASAATDLAAFRRPIDPTLPADHPLEPGRGTPYGRAASPAQRIADSEAALGPARASLNLQPAPKPDFIAAARRAAQAASLEASAGHKYGSYEADRGSISGGVRHAAKRVRSLLVAAGVVMILLASFQLGMSLLSPRHEVGSAPAESPPTEDASSASAVSATGATSDTESALPASPAAPTPIEQRSEEHSGDSPALISRTDVSGNKDAMAAANSSKGQPNPEPSLDAPVTTAAVQPGRALSAAAAEVSWPDPSIRTAPGDDLPAGFGSNRLRAAVLKGDATAQYEVGVRFAEGRGAPQDLPAAARWFERAAKQGLPLAQFRLGALYERGVGVKKDRERARQLYLESAGAGNPRAMHNLGVLHAEGIDGKPDYVSAVKWFRSAAEYGLADSQYNLGILYARGIAVQADLAEAYKWFSLAARGGDKEAVKKRDDVGRRLDQAALAALRATVAGWSPMPELESATTAKAPAGGWDDPPPAAMAKNRPKSESAAPRVR
jgi:localization factor PodJL